MSHNYYCLLITQAHAQNAQLHAEEKEKAIANARRIEKELKAEKMFSDVKTSSLKTLQTQKILFERRAQSAEVILCITLNF